MTRPVQFVGMLLLAAAAGVCAQNDKAAKDPVPSGSGWFRPGVPKGGIPKAGPKGIQKTAVRISNPTSLAAPLYRATPEQRDRALEKLPFPMQQRLRKELEQFDQLPKEQQETMIRQTERFHALPPEKQLAFRQELVALNHLEKDRKQQVAAALRRLHNVTADERAKILARPAFRERFSIEEFQIITTLAEVMLP